MNRVINFHQVSDSHWLEKTICYLKSKYSVVTADDLDHYYYDDFKLINSVHITADDGDKSFYNVIFPVLKKYKIPATLFVSPKICMEESNFWFQEIDAFDHRNVKKIISDVSHVPAGIIENNRIESLLKTMQISDIKEVINKCRKDFPNYVYPFQNMTVKQLLEVDKSGLVTIGAHTLNHPILMNESDSDSYREISKSIEELSEILNHEVRYFAYPNGIPELDFSEREIKYQKTTGIRLAFKNESGNLTDNNPFSIPRIAISDTESMNHLNFKFQLGKVWYSLKNLSPGSEYQERKKLIGSMLVAAISI